MACSVEERLRYASAAKRSDSAPVRLYESMMTFMRIAAHVVSACVGIEHNSLISASSSKSLSLHTPPNSSDDRQSTRSISGRSGPPIINSRTHIRMNPNNNFERRCNSSTSASTSTMVLFFVFGCMKIDAHMMTDRSSF